MLRGTPSVPNYNEGVPLFPTLFRDIHFMEADKDKFCSYLI